MEPSHVDVKLMGQPVKRKKLRVLSIKPVLDQRPAVQDHLRRTSLVYAHNSPRGTKTEMVRNVMKLRLKDWTRYGWTLPSVHRFCLRRDRYVVRTSPQRPAGWESPLETREAVERESGDGVETTRSLPPLQRTPLGQPMLRRPTVPWSVREVTHGDDLLNMLGNYLDLRPVTDDDPNKQSPGGSDEFYSTHYPLLLEKKFDDEPVDKVVNHRQVVARVSSEDRRRAELAKRCRLLELALTQLEQGSGDAADSDVLEPVFVTELRHETFDPRRWPWNSDRYSCS